MKKLIALILTAAISVSSCLTSFAEVSDDNVSETESMAEVDLAENRIIAFPGAEGAGKYATGGRGGKIYHVTNLNDSGPGSFRDAVSGSNRIVVFDVGGTIELKSDVVVKGNITIAGQTAPGGGGITLKNYKLGMGGDNIIIRFVSSRPGPDSGARDYDGWGGSHGSLSMIDHCATGWATDEQLALYSHNMYQTIQWSVIGPSDSWGNHPKGAHGFGIMFGRGQNSWHHNMIAHNISRNYRGKVVGTYVMDYVNNVNYDWGYQTAYGTHGHVNYVNNYFKAGNSTSGGYNYLKIDGSNRHNYRFYLTGNKIIDKDGTVKNSEDNNWADDVIDYATTLNNDAVLDSNGNKLQKGYCKVDKRMPLYDYGNITTYKDGGKTFNQYNPDSKKEDLSVLASENVDTADEAYEKVLAFAGTGINADSRTPIDKQVMEEAKNGTGTLTGTYHYITQEMIDKETSDSKKKELEAIKSTLDKNKVACDTVYEYPPKYTTKEIVDSDNDGMPDDWELARGLNPNSAADMNGDYCEMGYTNIEYYLNDLTVDAFPEGVVTLSPTNKNSVDVDPAADEVEGESYKTVAAAVAYMKENSGTSTKRKTIYIAPGTYNENITIEQNNLNIRPIEDKTGEVNISGLTVASSAENISVNGISLGSCTVSADKATFDDCKFLNTDTSVAVDNKSRAYFKNCIMSGTVSADSRVVFNGCTISADNITAKSTKEEGDKYGILIMNSKVAGTGNTLLGDIKEAFGQVVYYNCEISGVAPKTESDTALTNDKIIRISKCNTGGITPAYSKNDTEYDYNEKLTPFMHLKQKYGVSKADNWNPDGFDEVTPKNKLKEIADSISVPNTIILQDMELDSSFNTDLKVNVNWTSSDSSVLNGNTIVVGEYGSGVKYAKLTVELSLDIDGYRDQKEVREFNIIVGSLTGNNAGIVDFENETIGAESENLKMTTGYEQSDKIKWGVTNKIDGTEYADKGKFFGVQQSAKTEMDDKVDPGKGIHDFDYNFGKQEDKVFEVGFDFYMGNVSDGGYMEVYLRGSDSIGQLRISASEALANINHNSKDRKTIAPDTDEWLRFKMVVDTRGVSSGTAPKIDYYLLDESGDVKNSILNAAPAKEYTAANAARFIPSILRFRPTRSIDVCEFYIDNVYFKDLTKIAQDDAAAFEESYVMDEGDRLPNYGNQLSDITWKVVDGQRDVVNADGTINYDKCGNTALKVKGYVSYGDNLKGTAETGNIVLVVNGTGQNTEVDSDRYFNDKDESDFGKYYRQFGSAMEKIELNNVDNISGNSSAKIKLIDKAVFKKFNDPAGNGKVSFTTDFLADSTGRTFRIFFENQATEDDGNGFGSTDFSSNNIFYQLTDIDGTTYVITSDTPGANTGTTHTSQELGVLQPNKWYRLKIDLDFDNKTAVTSAYLHGTDGNYNVDNISDVPIGTVNSNLISKTPLELKQIRLVKTAAGNIYFDNVSVSAERKVTGVSVSPKSIEIKPGETYQLYSVISPSDALNKNVSWSSDNDKVASVSDKGVVTAIGVGETVIKVKTEDGEFSDECKVTVADEKVITIGDVNGDGNIDTTDVELTLKYVQNKDSVRDEEYIKRMNVTGNDEVTAEDAASIFKKVLDSNFEFKIKQ